MSSRSLPLLHAHVAEGDDAVVALEHQRAGGLFLAVDFAAGGLGGFGVFLHELAVPVDLDELGVGGLLAVGVELGGLEDDVEALPLAGGFGSVFAGGFDV